MSGLGCRDEISMWWSSLLSIAAYWMLGEDGKAAELYDCVAETAMPAGLAALQQQDVLPRALRAAFQAKKSVTSGGGRLTSGQILAQCNVASPLLEDSLTCNKIKAPRGIKVVSQKKTRYFFCSHLKFVFHFYWVAL